MNDVNDLKNVKRTCLDAIRSMTCAIKIADKFENKLIVQRLLESQSKLIFAKFAINQTLDDLGEEVTYDDDECSSISLGNDCPC